MKKVPEHGLIERLSRHVANPIFVWRESISVQEIRTDMVEVVLRHQAKPREIQYASPANLAEGLGVGRIHFFLLVGHEAKDDGIDMMAVVLEELGKLARVMVVVLKEKYVHRPV